MLHLFDKATYCKVTWHYYRIIRELENQVGCKIVPLTDRVIVSWLFDAPINARDG